MKYIMFDKSKGNLDSNGRTLLKGQSELRNFVLPQFLHCIIWVVFLKYQLLKVGFFSSPKLYNGWIKNLYAIYFQKL